MEPLFEGSERVRVEKRNRLATDRRPVEVKLEVTASQLGVVCVLMKAEHQVPFRLDPVAPIVRIVDALRIPEPDFQPSGFDIVLLTQKRRRLNGRDDRAWATRRQLVSNGGTPGLFRQSIMDLSE
jgi:hypothetical protein